MESWGEIIREAAASPAGVAALAMLVISGIALALFSRDDRVEIRVGIFSLMLIGAGLAVLAVSTKVGDQVGTPIAKPDREPIRQITPVTLPSSDGCDPDDFICGAGGG